MDIISIILTVFVVLEVSNVIMLYFVPGTTKGNGMGAFVTYEKVKKDPEVYALVDYLINWVAGTKLIFILLLIGIIILGTPLIKIFSICALIVSVATFYFRLYPSIKKMDRDNLIKPKGYSKTLGLMIGIFIFMFIIALIFFLIFN